eukprot:scaffold7807_cov62-Cyclotella_meneghiniana.AAC.5
MGYGQVRKLLDQQRSQLMAAPQFASRLIDVARGLGRHSKLESLSNILVCLGLGRAQACVSSLRRA